jgi:hypothetical protein
MTRSRSASEALIPGHELGPGGSPVGQKLAGTSPPVTLRAPRSGAGKYPANPRYLAGRPPAKVSTTSFDHYAVIIRAAVAAK